MHHVLTCDHSWHEMAVIGRLLWLHIYYVSCLTESSKCEKKNECNYSLAEIFLNIRAMNYSSLGHNNFECSAFQRAYM